MAALKDEYLPHYTYDDYIQWEGDWELIYGIPYAMAPAPVVKHQRISQRIAYLLESQLLACTGCTALVATDWKISEETVVCPDNLVICHEERNEKYLTQAPQLIFEILSKSTALKDQGLKFELYEREGVRNYVIIDPQSEVAKIYTINSEGCYKKVADVTEETIDFTLNGCRIIFDFAAIWK